VVIAHYAGPFDRSGLVAFNALRYASRPAHKQSAIGDDHLQTKHTLAIGENMRATDKNAHGPQAQGLRAAVEKLHV
jgi:hypothetical protein